MHPPIMRTAINFGALYGLASFAFFLLLFYAGLNPLSSSSMLGLWIPLVFIIIVIRYYRDHECGGYVTYWLAFRTGLLTIICGALLYALLLYLFGIVGAPDLVENYKEQLLSELGNSEGSIKGVFGEKLMDMVEESIDKTTLATLASTDFFNKCLGGLFLNLIAAAFLKRNPPADQIV